MRVPVELLAICACALSCPPPAQAATRAHSDGGGFAGHTGPASVLYQAQPTVVTVIELAKGTDSATISDVELADFDGDGRTDLAVAWYATDCDDPYANRRVLTIYFNDGATLRWVADFDLYIPHVIPALSVFRNGTADVGVGDFDGDGDADLAVTAFFGDELWFFENGDAGEFAPHLRFPFGLNSPAGFLTPPEALAADFDGDGRDELVCLIDPIQHIEARIIHFWKTSGTIADMHRVDWEGIHNSLFTQWTRGLALADFNADGSPDLCFSGSINPPFEDDPVLTFWYNLNPSTRRFVVHNEFPSMLCSDVVAVRPTPERPPGVMITDLDGMAVQYWALRRNDPFDFAQLAAVTGYAGPSTGWGMAGVTADVDGDGDLDLVTKQKRRSAADPDQIEITLFTGSGPMWRRVLPVPLDTTGFQSDPGNEILRPHNLAVADLFGNTLPEIVAGFGTRVSSSAGGRQPEATLDVAIWQNSCRGDVTVDGRTDPRDWSGLLDAFGSCAPSPLFNPDADLDKSGCVDQQDLVLLIDDLGCQRGECAGQIIADSDCSGEIDGFDIQPFTVAVSEGEAAWTAAYGGPGCDFLCVNDINGDESVDSFDVQGFVEMLTLHAVGGSAADPR